MHVKVKTKGTENSAGVKKWKRIFIHHLEIQFAVFAFFRSRLRQIGDYFSTLLRDVNLFIKKKNSAKPSNLQNTICSKWHFLQSFVFFSLIHKNIQNATKRFRIFNIYTKIYKKQSLMFLNSKFQKDVQKLDENAKQDFLFGLVWRWWYL